VRSGASSNTSSSTRKMRARGVWKPTISPGSARGGRV
jgi:hypothetical protein